MKLAQVLDGAPPSAAVLTTQTLIIGYDMMTNYFGLDVAAQGKTPRAFYYQGLSVRSQFDF